MRLVIAPKAKSRLPRLPKSIQKKAHRQFGYLLVDYRHPSLRARKMEGIGRFEARIDRKYRFTFMVVGDEIYVLSVGPHDEGLGKN